MYNVNSVKNLYVVKQFISSGDITTSGDIKISTDPVGKVYFQIYGGGGKLRTDVIDKTQIRYATAKGYEDLDTKFKQIVIELKSTINSGLPVAGETYEIKAFFPNVGVLSNESVQYKFANLYVTADMTADEFYIQLAKELVINLNNGIENFKIYLTEETTNKGTVNTTWQEVTQDSTHTPTTAFTGIIVSEQSQANSYKRGILFVSNLEFTMSCGTIRYNASDILPFVVDKNKQFIKVDKVPASSTDMAALPNGYNLAELEYFCFGERGDQLRNNDTLRAANIKWMIDPNEHYDVISIGHSRHGIETGGQFLGKEIMLAVYNASGHTVTNNLITAINTALDVNIPTL